MSDRTLDVALRLAPRGAGGLVVDAAFRAPPGVTVLFGPSGAGKSTLLAAIAGLLRPAGGRVSLGGEVWYDAERRVDRAPQERGVSFVFQSLALFPHLTAIGNVEYGIDRAVPRAERRRRAGLMLDRMKVPHLARRRPRTYSGGEAQRVALARAFARQPRLVLLDEPFSALDRDLRRALLYDVRAMIAEQQIPAILVTHQTAEARLMGDRVVLIEEGRIQGEGTLEELFEGTPLPEAP